MSKMKDWTGEKFGYLTLLKFLRKEIINKRHKYIYLVKCICGKEKELDICDLKKGTTRSCGCLRKKLQSERKIKPPGIAARNNLYNIYLKTCVEKRGYEFELTKEEFFNLTKQNCYYCGKEPTQIKKSKVSQYVYNGIDRVDNSKGYLKDNVVACCGKCNADKSGVTKEIVLKVYEFLKKNGTL